MPRFTVDPRGYIRDNDKKVVYTSLHQVVEVMNSIETQRSMAQWEVDRSQSTRSSYPTGGSKHD